MCRIFIILITIATVLTACSKSTGGVSPAPTTYTSVSSSYIISGTVSYSGAGASGRVYLEVFDTSGRDTGIGTSIASPGLYSIRGVPTGAYILGVWMDNSNPQLGIPNELSPSGRVSVSVNDGNVSGQDISILDPSVTPAPVAPTNVNVFPSNESALIRWTAPQGTNGSGLPQYYNIYYDTSSSVSPSTGIKETVQANNYMLVSGLTDGTTYYFVVTAVLGGVESSPSTPAASATIGATSGSNTISGAISFPVIATGPMCIGVSGKNGTFFQRIEKPASPQSYSVSGVPNGTYDTFAFIDMNNDGVIDTGDLNKTSNTYTAANTAITVNGDMTRANQTLVGTSVLARVTTVHFGSTGSPSNDIYYLQFEVASNMRLPITVALISGPNVSAPIDIGGNYYHRLVQTVKVKPKVGDSYVLAINYSDGTSDEVSVSVTAVLDSFAQNLTTSGTDRNIPTLNWSAPASPPADYTYLIQVEQSNAGPEWTYPQSGNGMPSSQTSVPYNVDGSASLTILQTGTSYDWLIYVIDLNGNQAIYKTTYTP